VAILAISSGQDALLAESLIALGERTGLFYALAVELIGELASWLGK
jgi:hypothetical protein